MVVGAGIMGHGFAQYLALNNIRVALVDQTDEFLERARMWITDNLNYMVELGEIEPDRIQSTLDRIDFRTDLEQAAGECDIAIEAVCEDLELKKSVYRNLGNWTRPDVILASNTSSFDINELTSVTRHPERVIGIHWFHPPQITPGVEIIPADETSRQTIDFSIQFMEHIGKYPTLCKSAPGFVGNRLQMALAAEAFAIVEDGLATPEQVDRIVKSCFGFRLGGAYGPFEIADQAGIDTYQSIFEYLYENLKRPHFKPPRLLNDLKKKGKFGLKTQEGFYEYRDGGEKALRRERDRKFYARLRLFRDEIGS